MACYEDKEKANKRTVSLNKPWAKKMV